MTSNPISYIQAMIQAMCQDIQNAAHCLPLAIGVSLFAAVLSLFLRSKGHMAAKRRNLGRTSVYALFSGYLSILLYLTLFSRESGSRSGTSLIPFETWGLSPQGNAYVLENILLFLPYGFLFARTFTGIDKRKHAMQFVIFCGFITSTAIECIQLLTGRGYFQLDDIITNTAGMLLGNLIDKWWCKHRRSKVNFFKI